MDQPEGLVKSNIEKQVVLLETRLTWKIVAVRIALVFFMLLTEVMPFIQHYRMVDKWHSIQPLLRLSVYSALLIFQYFMSRLVIQRKFGRHLAYLKELMNEMQ